MNNNSLKAIERQAYRSTFSDGIYDIQFGLIFMIFALIAVLKAYSASPIIGYSLLFIPLIFPWLGKRYITIPRMGKVEFGEKRRKRKLIAIAVAVLILILTAPLMLMIIMKGNLDAMGWKLIAIFVAPIFVLIVYTTEFLRLYVYAALLIFGVVEAEFLLRLTGSPLNAVLSFGFPGLIITVIGIGLLIKFIKTHPLVELDYAE
jgi:hypothetical protein